MNAHQNKGNVKKKYHCEATYIRCPYNRRHYVLDRIYESHLVSCGQSNPHINVIICPYNGSHRCRTIEAMVNWIFLRCSFRFLKLRTEF